MPFKNDCHFACELEPLEPRVLLSAAPLVEIGTQPAGALSDKIVYLHAGHGYTFSGGSWQTQRDEFFELVEDFGNQDQMTSTASIGSVSPPHIPWSSQTP